MNERKFALYTLLNLIKLSQKEISRLTLGDLHLSDTPPYLKIWADNGKRRKVNLDDTTKKALVVWLVARPDQPSKVLFPDETGMELSEMAIDALLENYSAPSLPSTEKGITGEDILAAEKLPTFPPKKAPSPPPFSAVRPVVSPEHVASVPPFSASRPKVSPERMTPSSKLPISQGEQSVTLQPKWGAIIIGGLGLMACIGLLWVGSVMMKGRNIADEQAAIMGDAPTFAAIEVTPSVENTIEPTATLEATNTPNPMPTDTPLPTATATDTSPPTKTHTPTAIPAPTDTPVPPTATPAPTDTATSVPAVVSRPTATPGLKYAAPILLSPEKNAYFIVGNLIDLKWESVGELAGNEQYAVRLIYKHNAELVYRGDSLKEMVWRVPTGFYRDADGPEFDYEWYVYVEEIQPDGTGVPVSPESEHRHFKWE